MRLLKLSTRVPRGVHGSRDYPGAGLGGLLGAQRAVAFRVVGRHQSFEVPALTVQLRREQRVVLGVYRVQLRRHERLLQALVERVVGVVLVQPLVEPPVSRDPRVTTRASRPVRSAARSGVDFAAFALTAAAVVSLTPPPRPRRRRDDLRSLVAPRAGPAPDADARSPAAAAGGELDEARLRLDQSVHEPVPDVVPYPLRRQLERVAVVGFVPVVQRTPPCVPPAPHGAAHEARPQIPDAAASLAPGLLLRILRVSTHRAGRVSPAAEARRVERVRAHRGDHTADVLVEAIQAHGTRGELAEVPLGRRQTGIRIHRLAVFSFELDRAHEKRPALTLD